MIRRGRPAYDRRSARARARAGRAARGRGGRRSPTRRGACSPSRRARCVDLPPFPSSAMDGFAVRAADAPGELPVVARSRRRPAARRALAAGEAMAISTGGVVPEGADAVVPIEHVDEHDGTRSCTSSRCAAGRQRPAAGGDVRAGEMVVEAGAGSARRRSARSRRRASRRVACARRPRVAVLATGTELRAPGEPLGAGRDLRVEQLTCSRRSSSRGRRRRAARSRSRTTRTRDARSARARASRPTCSSPRAASRSGRTTSCAARSRSSASRRSSGASPSGPASRSRSASAATTLVFGLPGNPVSSLVGFELFVRPALLALQGAARPRPAFRAGALGGGDLPRTERARRARARAHARRADGRRARAAARPGVAHDRARAAADALVLVPRGTASSRAGAPVSYLPL